MAVATPVGNAMYIPLTVLLRMREKHNLEVEVAMVWERVSCLALKCINHDMLTLATSTCSCMYVLVCDTNY